MQGGSGIHNPGVRLHSYQIMGSINVAKFATTRENILRSVYNRPTAVQSQKAVTAYFTSKQLLPFGFARQNYKCCLVNQLFDISSVHSI